MNQAGAINGLQQLVDQYSVHFCTRWQLCIRQIGRKELQLEVPLLFSGLVAHLCYYWHTHCLYSLVLVASITSAQMVVAGRERTCKSSMHGGHALCSLWPVYSLLLVYAERVVSGPCAC